MTRTNLLNPQDEWLADFADQVLEGRITDLSTIVSADPEMRQLANTILQLKTAFPAQATDAASAKRVQARVMAHARDEQERKSRWEKYTRTDWFAQKRPRTAITALLAVFVLAVVAGPALFQGGGPITGSAGTGLSIGWVLWILLGVLVLAGFWLTRRK